MSWFRSTPSSTKTEPSQAADGSYKPMDRNERKACWDARDAYFSCLDKYGVLDAVKNENEAKRKCGGEDQAFERDCAASWVKYFKQKRVAEYEKDQKMKKLEADGAVPASEASKPWYKVW